MPTNLIDLVIRAHANICMAHVFESFDWEAAFKREVFASEDAYLVGRCSADDLAMPSLFAHSRALTFAWERARADRAAIAVE